MSFFYCSNCALPSTRPSLRFNDNGVCSACSWSKAKYDQNFYDTNGGETLLDIVKSSKSHPDYDCIIPVSGGKDSTYQVWRVLSLGLNPLCVTAPTDFLTPLGRRNIENIKSMGVDHIEFSVNTSVRRKINRYSLETVGDIQWPEHVLIFTIPVHVAVRFGVPVILWGENTVREYGAGREEHSHRGVEFTREYMEEYSGFNGLRVTDIEDHLGIQSKHLSLYRYPSADSVSSLGVRGLFLDDFFPWNGMTNQLIARANGFEAAPNNIVGTLSNYENLDNYYHGIHDYFKYLKFGYSRSSDLASNWIRRGLISRDDAFSLIRTHDGVYPSVYLDKSLEDILATIDMSKSEFDQICDDFTNYELFQLDSNGNLLRRSDGSPQLLQPNP